MYQLMADTRIELTDNCQMALKHKIYQTVMYMDCLVLEEEPVPPYRLKVRTQPGGTYEGWVAADRVVK